jgi:two-component system, NarL family, sensor histidine kinase UhpB
MSCASPSPDDQTIARSAPRDVFHGPFGGLLRAMHDAIVMVDDAQTIVAFNPAAEVLLACTPAQALGQPLSRFIPEADRAAHEHHVRSFAQSQVMQREMAPQRRVRALRADGREVPVEVTLSRVDAVIDGKVVHWFAALLRDLSAEQSLRKEVDIATRRLHTALDATPAAIWIVEDERIDYANRAAALVAGLPCPLALVGKTLSSVLPPATVQALRQALAGADAPARVPGQLQRNDGQMRDIEIALANLPDHGHAVVQMVIEDVTERRRAAAEVERAGQSLRRLQANVVEAREEERRRIARELHDELGQRLTALKMDVTALAQNSCLDPSDSHVQSMQTMLDETLASVRRIASDLRPLMLDDLGLNAAIEWLARDMARRTGIDIVVRLDDTHAAPSSRVATVLYRATQEALTNVVRHAAARHVAIELEAQDQQWVLTVQDDGMGLPDPALLRDDAFGLMGIHERAAMLGGRLTVETVGPQGGTRLTMTLPITVSRDPQ